MAKKRQSRKELGGAEDLDKLKPINVLSLGSADDPCFGKLHDLLAKECRLCGDSEFCAIATAQSLRLMNLSGQDGQRFKDVEEAKLVDNSKLDKAKGLIKKYRKDGLKNTKILLKVSRELNLSKDLVKPLIY